VCVFSEHISVNTAELNVLEMRQKEPQNLNAVSNLVGLKEIQFAYQKFCFLGTDLRC